MDLDSDDDFEFEEDKIRIRNIYVPSSNLIVILTIMTIILMLIFERLFIYIFLLIIPSYFLLIIVWIIIHLIILRFIILLAIFPGKNKIIQFYLRNVQARIRVNSLKNFLLDLINKIDILINTPNSEENENESSINENFFYSINHPLKIYKKVIETYGKLGSYEENFYKELNELKNMLQNTSIARYSRRIGKSNLIINISNEERERYPIIKNQINRIIFLLKEFLFENEFKIKQIFHYIHVFLYNNIFRTIEYLRVQSTYKKYIYEQIKIESNSYKLDCLLIKGLIKNKDKKVNSNIVIVCGPNLTPFENLIRSWEINDLYLVNNTDVFFWNYRGFEYSEGNANLKNVRNDVENVYDYIINLGIYKKIAVHGLSIGGIAACHLAKNKFIDLLIADRTFGSINFIINSYSTRKILNFLAKILFIPMVDNCFNFINTNCNKVVMNDPKDETVSDKISLKTQISKECIYKIFNLTNFDLNVRNIKSYNILDYALEPDDNIQIFECFKYTIDFIKLHNNKKKNYKFENDNNLKENLNENEDNISMKKLIDIFIKKIKKLYSHFSSCGDSLEDFIDFNNTREHFDNFFDNFFIFGAEEKDSRYVFCNINECNNLLEEFIYNSENQIINDEEIRKYSENELYNKFSTFVNLIKTFKIYILGIHLNEIDEKWIKKSKGTLIPLSCGHIAFYDDIEFDSLKYIVKKVMIDDE